MSPTATGKRYLSDKALASRYAVTPRTIWRWAKVGKLPKPVQLAQGTSRWDARDIARFEADRDVGKR